jgi:hypothetical protein
MASICVESSSNKLQEGIAISRRPTPKSLESLRLTLQQLEQTGNPNDASISELKRVILNRIADLELAKKLETSDSEIDNAPGPADLVPPQSMAEEGPMEEANDQSQLEKLD